MEYTTREQLIKAADEDYRKFASKLLPDTRNILGVRLPELRKLAKGIAKRDWRNYLRETDYIYFEEIMVHGMIIGYARADIDEVLKYTAEFIPLIDNWSVCDSFCSGLKIANTYKDKVFNFLLHYTKSEKEFEVRFAVVMFLNYYLDKQYIERVLDILGEIKQTGYYARMAVAWAISICFIREPGSTMELLKSNKLDEFTYNKALQKIIESNVVDKATKELIRSMKIRK